MKFFSLLAVFTLFLYACNKEDIELSNYEQNVYDMFNDLQAPLSSISLIPSQTDTSHNCNAFLQFEIDTLGVTQNVIQECIELNKTSMVFDTEKFTSGGVKIFPQSELDELGLSGVMEKYGSGIKVYGKPYFYDGGKKAIFESSYLCGPLCGSGSITIMEKMGNMWVVRFSQMTWISK